MSKPKRIQHKRTKGWTMPPNTVYVGRPTIWGNPFPLQHYSESFSAPDLCVRLFRELSSGIWDGAAIREIISNSLIGCGCPECDKRFEGITGRLTDLTYQHRCAWEKRSGKDFTHTVRRELRGKDLACWCPLDQPCHADVLLEIARRGNV